MLLENILLILFLSLKSSKYFFDFIIFLVISKFQSGALIYWSSVCQYCQFVSSHLYVVLHEQKSVQTSLTDVVFHLLFFSYKKTQRNSTN